VADVHLGPIEDILCALEEGVGHANEIYVVFPIEGKLTLGRGAVFDYYEFVVPIQQELLPGQLPGLDHEVHRGIGDRLTDEKWQEMLASDDPPRPPKWTRSFLSPRKGTGESVEFQQLPEFTAGGC
jgi:hypothetical protein